MKTMAQIDNEGIVINITIANDDWSAEGFVEYTDNNPAYIGGTYANGKFIPPKPTPDAVLDEATCQWIVPDSISADSVGADSL
jgi:hypothetical protein